MFWWKTMWCGTSRVLICLEMICSNKDLLRSACAKKGSVYETHMLQWLIPRSGAHRHRAEAVELLDSCSCIGDACKRKSNQDSLKHNRTQQKVWLLDKCCHHCHTSTAAQWLWLIDDCVLFLSLPFSFSFSSSFRLDLCVSAISMYFSWFVIMMLGKGWLIFTHINIVCALQTAHQDILSCVEFYFPMDLKVSLCP